MEHLVDLDVLANRLRSVVEDWRRHAEVGPFTWRDERAPWPQPIVDDRSRIEVPESLGIRLRRDPDDEFEIVVWTGGWADVDFVLDGERGSLGPEFKDVDGACAAVVKNVEDFLTRRPRGSAGTHGRRAARVVRRWAVQARGMRPRMVR